MKKLNLKKLFALFAGVVSAIVLVCVFLSSSVKAEDGVTYEDADIVSIGDLVSKKSIELKENTRYTYDKTATRGSLVFKFDLENNEWIGNSNMQIYFTLDEESYQGDYFWNNKNCFWFKNDNTHMMQQKEDGSFGWHSLEGLTAENHSIEIGRLAIIRNKKYTGEYYCYYKVDGVIKDSCISEYDYKTLTNVIFISGGANNPNKLVDPDFVEPTYEEPDRISISDLTLNGKAVGNKLLMTKHNYMKYTSTTQYGSVVLTFKYKISEWDSDDDGSLFYLYNGWNANGMFWLRPDGIRLTQVINGENYYHWTPGKTITTGVHDVELSRIAILSGENFTGKYVFKIVIDNVVYAEATFGVDPEYISNDLFTTGTKNALVDPKWDGNHITLMANKEVFDEYDSKDDFITKPAVDPTCPGKIFKGWFDEMGNEWDFENDEVKTNMTLTAAFVSEDSQTVDDETYFSDDNFTPVLRFLASSDNHVSKTGSNISRLTKVFEVAYQYAENSTKYSGLDAALFAGDLSDDGSQDALANWIGTVKGCLQDGTALIVSMGNHEFRTYDSVTHEIKVFEEAMEQKCDIHVVVKGYHFIALSPNLNEGYNFSNTKVKWLEKELAAAQEADPTKPIFVIQHEHVKGTVYGSESWGMDELTEVLCKYPQVVDFSGHSHYPLADERSIWQGTFTALGTGTLHYYELGINGYKYCNVFPTDKTGGWATANNNTGSTAEFLIVELDANNAMRVIVYDLMNNREITRYYMRDIMEDRKLTYSHTERKKTAENPFWQDVTLNATAEENTVKLEFEQATCADTVESYRIELYSGGKLVQTEYALSDYFFYPVPAKIKVSIPYLKENTEYTIKVYAVNVWGMESEDAIEATVTTGTVTIYEDVIDEISLNDLYGESDNKKLTTDTLKSWKPAYFKPSENNIYGSFKIRLQLKYVGNDFQFYWNANEIYTNNDLLWVNNGEKGIYLHEEKITTTEKLPPGFYIVEYGRYHITEGEKKGYTAYYVKINGDNYNYEHTCYSDRRFTTDGHIIFNFNSCYGAGSRYYDINYDVPREESPEFVDAQNVNLTNPINDWKELGGALKFKANTSSVNVWLEGAEGPVTNVKTFTGKFTLGTNGDFYQYEIKTNQFELAGGVTGKEPIVRICFEDTNFKYGDLEPINYEKEVLADYDEISVYDIGLPDNPGIYSNSPTEHGFAYNGTSETYSAVLRYYLITDDLTSTSEFRSQLGSLWSYFCFMWLQEGNSKLAFFGSYYTTRPSDKYSVNINSRSIYLFETGTIRVEKGEWAGYNYTYMKIDGELISGYYVPAEECASTAYQVAFKIVDGYHAADISLARNIEYIVDGETYKNELAISGARIYEPTRPADSEGHYFTGWYTAPTGGERVNFNDTFVSDNKNVKYYARFSDTLYTVDFYNENELYQSQSVGKGGQALIPTTPTKLGTYKYSFINWVIRGTNTPFDFSAPLEGNVELEAVYEEYQYKIVYRVDGKEYEVRHYLESNPTEIIGGEPEVPAYAGCVGYWDYDVENRTLGDTYAIARYNGVAIEESNGISLNKFDGATVDIADELTRYYLSFVDTQDQADWLNTYPVSGGHEFQDISFSWNDTTGNTNYIVYFADNIEFENAFVIRTNKTKVENAGIFVPGQTYYWKVVGEKTGKSSTVDTFTILNTPVRWISAGTVYNMRDIGGWITTDGKQVAYGNVYRGGQLSLDQSGEASYMNDYSFKVFDYLGMRTEVELRGESKHTLNQFNDLETMLHVNGTGYLDIFKMSASTRQNYKDIITLLADSSNYPLYFHCSWGADRTGFMGFFINGLLGVPYEQLVQDFELTSLSYSGRRVRGATGFDAMVERLMTDYSEGGTLKDALENFFIDFVGVKKADIEAMRANMLVEAKATAQTHTITYMIDGEVYLQSKVFDGGLASSVAPVYFERHLDYWLLDGEVYDLSTPVTSDLVLEAVYADTEYEPYDLITVRDLGIEDWTPCISEPFNYTGTSTTGTRMFEFMYEIPDTIGTFNDGVHIEIGSTVWLYKAHIWIMGDGSQHVFTNGTGTPTTSPSIKMEIGNTYRIRVGVVIPLQGEYAGEKVLFLMIDDDIVCQLPCSPDLIVAKSIGMAGTQGILHSVDNYRNVTFKNSDGQVIETIQVSRGLLATQIETPEAPENKVFIGWFDELGNKWNFASDKLYNDVTLVAKFGDKTINALVLDNNDFEIVNNFEVVVGARVGDLEVPAAKANLEFDGWYNGIAKLSDDDIVLEEMELICRFNVKEVEPTDPVDPVNPVEPDNKKGCNGSISLGLGFITLLSLSGLFFIKKKKENE